MEKYWFMITILIIPMLNQAFSSLHKEFIGESNALIMQYFLLLPMKIQFVLSCFYKVHAVYPNI